MILRRALQDTNDRLAAALGLLLLAVVGLTVDDYGMTWDEPAQSAYGWLVFRYYDSGFRNLGALNHGDLHFYGGLFDGLIALISRNLHINGYGFRHVVNAFAGLLGIVATWRIGRLLGGPRLALLSAAFLTATPCYYGQLFNNPKDVPFAAAMAWALYYVLVAVRRAPSIPVSVQWRLGVAVGCALGIRVGALILFGYAAVVFVATALWRRNEPLGAWVARTVLASALPVILAWAIMLFFWPWAQQAPFTRPFIALREMSRFPHEATLLLGGAEVSSTHLPVTYLPHLLAVTLPELMLIAFVIAALHGGRQVWRRNLDEETAIAWLGVIVGVVLPVYYVTVSGATLYNSWRHLMFIAPPMAVLAAAGVEAVLRLAWGAPGGRARLAVAALLGGYALWHVSVLVRLHPHEYVYFNQVIGGLAGAEGKYELEYYGNSGREAVSKLVEKLQAGPSQPQPYKVLVCGEPQTASYYFPPELVLTENPEEADFFIEQRFVNCAHRANGPEYVRVEREGVALTVVRDVRALPEK